MFRLLSILLVGVMLTSVAVAADEVHQGTVILAKDGKISIQDKDGNSEVFTLAPDAKITLDGKPAKLEDISNGNTAKVTVAASVNKKLATMIEAKSKE